MAHLQTTITSSSNGWLKRLRQAAARGTTVGEGFALAESFHLLQEALRSKAEVQRVFAARSAVARAEASIPPHRAIPLHPVADGLFGKVATTARSQGVLTLVRLPVWEPEQALRGLTIVLDCVQDPGNAGTIVRTAEAFGAGGVVFLAGSATPGNPKTLRAAAGSLFRLPFLARLATGRFLALAAEREKRLLATVAGDGQSLAAADLSDTAAVIIGSETHGVSPRLLAASRRVAIPTRTVESLNAAIAAAIVLYESARPVAGP